MVLGSAGQPQRPAAEAMEGHLQHGAESGCRRQASAGQACAAASATLLGLAVVALSCCRAAEAQLMYPLVGRGMPPPASSATAPLAVTLDVLIDSVQSINALSNLWTGFVCECACGCTCGALQRPLATREAIDHNTAAARLRLPLQGSTWSGATTGPPPPWPTPPASGPPTPCARASTTRRAASCPATTRATRRRAAATASTCRTSSFPTPWASARCVEEGGEERRGGHSGVAGQRHAQQRPQQSRPPPTPSHVPQESVYKWRVWLEPDPLTGQPSGTVHRTVLVSATFRSPFDFRAWWVQPRLSSWQGIVATLRSAGPQ